MNAASNPTPARKGNLRLALILASVSMIFFVGFIVKMSMFSHH
jgi:hypothetical protein